MVLAAMVMVLPTTMPAIGMTKRGFGGTTPSHTEAERAMVADPRTQKVATGIAFGTPLARCAAVLPAITTCRWQSPHTANSAQDTRYV